MTRCNRIRHAVLTVVAASCLVEASAALAQNTNGDVEEGRKLFMSNGCYSCHGTVGQGGERSGGARLAPDPYPFTTFEAIVRNPPEAMPRFDPLYLPDAQLKSIHAYLASIRKGPGVKDLPLLQGSAR